VENTKKRKSFFALYLPVQALQAMLARKKIKIFRLKDLGLIK